MYSRKPTCPHRLLQPLDTHHSLAGMGKNLSQVERDQGLPCLSVESSEEVCSSTTMRAWFSPSPGAYDEILQPDPCILLWRRSACKKYVPVHSQRAAMASRGCSTTGRNLAVLQERLTTGAIRGSAPEALPQPVVVECPDAAVQLVQPPGRIVPPADLGPCRRRVRVGVPVE